MRMGVVVACSAWRRAPGAGRILLALHRAEARGLLVSPAACCGLELAGCLLLLPHSGSQPKPPSLSLPGSS